ncbi:MAG: hypothetical protein KIS66_00805 [Fimbriimonadaceae bacterium]|nr:hypothetical protein [Fimbriimonadaceae bacterium]
MTLDALSDLLNRFGWRDHKRFDQKGEREGYLSAGWSNGPLDNGFTLYVDPVVEQGLLVFSVPRLAFLPRGLKDDLKLKALQEIAARNRTLPLGGYSYDPADGEVVYRLGVPLPSTESLSYEQFSLCMRVCASAAEACGSSVFGVLDEAGPRLAEAGSEVADGSAELFDQFQRFLAERKGRSKEGPPG